MARKTRGSKEMLVCPSCQTPLLMRISKNELKTCPNCGDWVIARGRFSRELERFQEDFEVDIGMGDELGQSTVVKGN